eukprot:TRINITY_DN39770_c0_g1_i1.p1 TRINITY_DN39770_c0_g1~~TRINITY_DN39770_c0_g1_i1.p1  ORF type:complete len:501 (+),score=57.58 TRINITY_DN39770_c0_g1_i1:118-1620(+)
MLGGCTRPPSSSAGVFERMTCDFKGGELKVVTQKYNVAPVAPTRVRCDDSGAGSKSLLALCEVDPVTVDLVSFEVSGLAGAIHGRPFLSVTAQPQSYGLVSVPITGLRSGTDYVVAARSHRKGLAEGDPDAWSNITVGAVTCATRAADSSFEAELPPAPAPGVRTKKLEVYRATVGMRRPDFLDQHNAGDMTGELSYAGLWARARAITEDRPALLTRYCVEVADVSLPNVSTGTKDGQPKQSRYFADYASCHAGKCSCMHQVDRFVARHPEPIISTICDGPIVNATGNLCQCGEVALTLSNHYVGMSRVPTPFHLDTSLLQNPVIFPDTHPMDVEGPTGYWYSFPLKGRCPAGVGVGTYGCTWQRSPVSYTVYGDDLLRYGMDDSIFKTPSTSGEQSLPTESYTIEASTTQRNIDVVKKAFDVLGVPSCGSDEQEQPTDDGYGGDDSSASVPCKDSTDNKLELPTIDAIDVEVQATMRTIVYASALICLGSALTLCLRDG